MPTPANSQPPAAGQAAHTLRAFVLPVQDAVIALCGSDASATAKDYEREARRYLFNHGVTSENHIAHLGAKAFNCLYDSENRHFIDIPIGEPAGDALRPTANGLEMPATGAQTCGIRSPGTTIREQIGVKVMEFRDAGITYAECMDSIMGIIRAALASARQ